MLNTGTFWAGALPSKPFYIDEFAPPWRQANNGKYSLRLLALVWWQGAAGHA